MWRPTSGNPMTKVFDKARVLLNRSDALTVVPRPSMPIALPQTQSPLFSALPPELRNRIFELVVTLDSFGKVPVEVGEDQEYDPDARRKATPPAITRTSLLVLYRFSSAATTSTSALHITILDGALQRDPHGGGLPSIALI